MVTDEGAKVGSQIVLSGDLLEFRNRNEMDSSKMSDPVEDFIQPYLGVSPSKRCPNGGFNSEKIRKFGVQPEFGI